MTVTLGLTDDLASCLALRKVVFIDEQGVSLADEQDGLDDQALHLLARLDGQPVGCARLLTYGDTGKIGRVCVLVQARGTGLGAALVRAGVDHFRSVPGVTRVLLGAQVTATGFYERLGFVSQGDVFMDAGIPHRKMVLTF